MKSHGFTLVEVLIVVAIIAILVALALPNYQDSVRKARRADAQVKMMEFANIAERLYTEDNNYLRTDDDVNSNGIPDAVEGLTIQMPLISIATLLLLVVLIMMSISLRLTPVVESAGR